MANCGNRILESLCLGDYNGMVKDLHLLAESQKRIADALELIACIEFYNNHDQILPADGKLISEMISKFINL